jgi:hypothetical protein
MNRDKNQPIYLLNQHENYHTKLEYSVENINAKYNELVFEYLNFVAENKKMVFKNSDYFKFVVFRGLYTISHVFYFILMYSNNLDMAYYHSQRSYYFYIEFIEQISDDLHSFLKLSSRDAVLFVYKKTINEIPADIQKNVLFLPETMQILKIVSLNIENMKDMLDLIIEGMKLFTKEKLVQITKEIRLVWQKITGAKNNKEIMHALNFFMKHHFIRKYMNDTEKNNTDDNNMIVLNCEIMTTFIAKLTKIKSFDDGRKENMKDQLFITIQPTTTITEYINLLFIA